MERPGLWGEEGALAPPVKRALPDAGIMRVDLGWVANLFEAKVCFYFYCVCYTLRLKTYISST